MRTIPELAGKTIHMAMTSHAKDCELTELDLKFTDGTSYSFVVDTEPTVKGIMYHSELDNDETESLLHHPEVNN